MNYDVFISYSRLDTSVADRICEAFDKAKITYFIDRQGIGGGFEFPAVLAEAIIESKVVLFLASKNSYESKFTTAELTFAFNEKPTNSIIPYIIDGSTMPHALRLIFSSINWRNIETHPIETTLIEDIKKLLGLSSETINTEVNLVPYISNNKVGFANPDTREIIIPCKYDDAREFSEGLARVKLNGKWGFIDKTGREVVIPCKYDISSGFIEGLARVQYGYKYGFIDKTGYEVIPCKYDLTFGFSEGLAAVKCGYKHGFIDKTGREVIPCKYDDADSFHEGLASIELNGKDGYVDRFGNELWRE